MYNKNEYIEINCNLCGANDSYIFYNKILTKKNKKLSEIYSPSSNDICYDQIVKCKNCGLIYINPRLKDDLIINGYTNSIDEAYISQKESRIKTFTKVLRLIESFYSNRGRILDVGTAAGFLLKVAKESGWETFGIEPSIWMCEYANRNFDVNVQQGTLIDGLFENNFFDVVVLWDVLEHIPDPLSTLKIINKILKPKGLIIINFPNIEDIFSKVLGRKWWFILSAHLYYFSTKTLFLMLKKCNFIPFYAKPQFQQLELGYLIYRLKPYSNILFKLMSLPVNFLKLNKLQITYYASQTTVIARKTTPQ